MEWDVIRVLLAQRFNWTLTYIDSLSVVDVMSVMAVLDGMGKAQDGS